MIAAILISPNLEERIGEAEKILSENELIRNHPDVLWLEETQKLGVEQAKKIREFLSLKPYSAAAKAVFLENAQNLTRDAQNALLKTLEELPEHTIFLLGSQSENIFLPTVLSRCRVIRVKSQESRVKSQESRVKSQESEVRDGEKFLNDIKKLREATIEERFVYIEKLEDREEFFLSLIFFFQKELHSNPKEPTVEFAKQLLKAEEWVKSNGNIRASLEYLMLKMPEGNDK